MDVFIHIPKTAGSTIRTILSRQYGADGILYFEPGSPGWPAGVTQQQFLDREREAREVRLVTGHHPYGVHERLKTGVRYFSMMRDPVARQISNYFYAFSYEHHPLRASIRAGELTPQQFIRQQARLPGTAQSHLLAGASDTGAGLRAAACHNLEHAFQAVGIAERFDESLLYIAKVMNWHPPVYMRRNVTRLDDERQAERHDSEMQVRTILAHLLADDYAAYHRAQQVMDQWIAAEGSAFATAHAAFAEIQHDIARQDDDRKYAEYFFQNDARLPALMERYAGSAAFRTMAEYLAAPLALPRATPNYTGQIDLCRGGAIAGWALDLGSFAPVEVQVLRYGSELAHIRAERARPDVLAAGYPRADVGFRFEHPALQDPSGVEVLFGSGPLRLRWSG